MAVPVLGALTAIVDTVHPIIEYRNVPTWVTNGMCIGHVGQYEEFGLAEELWTPEDNFANAVVDRNLDALLLDMARHLGGLPVSVDAELNHLWTTQGDPDVEPGSRHNKLAPKLPVPRNISRIDAVVSILNCTGVELDCPFDHNLQTTLPPTESHKTFKSDLLSGDDVLVSSATLRQHPDAELGKNEWDIENWVVPEMDRCSTLPQYRCAVRENGQRVLYFVVVIAKEYHKGQQARGKGKGKSANNNCGGEESGRGKNGKIRKEKGAETSIPEEEDRMGREPCSQADEGLGAGRSSVVEFHGGLTAGPLLS